MPGRSLIVIEMVIPKVILVSILSVLMPLPSLLFSLAYLDGFSEVGLPVPLPWMGQRPLLLRQHCSCQLCCFYQMSSEGERVPPRV